MRTNNHWYCINIKRVSNWMIYTRYTTPKYVYTRIKHVIALRYYLVHSERQCNLGDFRVGTSIGLGRFVLYTFRENRIAGLRGTSLYNTKVKHTFSVFRLANGCGY